MSKIEYSIEPGLIYYRDAGDEKYALDETEFRTVAKSLYYV